MSDDAITTEMLAQAIADSKTPEGIATMLERVAETLPDGLRGSSTIIRGCAAQVRQLVTPHERDDRTVQEALLLAYVLDDDLNLTDDALAAVVAHASTLALDALAGRPHCSGTVNEDGVLQHPGESCPVHDAETGLVGPFDSEDQAVAFVERLAAETGAPEPMWQPTVNPVAKEQQR